MSHVRTFGPLCTHSFLRHQALKGEQRCNCIPHPLPRVRAVGVCKSDLSLLHVLWIVLSAACDMTIALMSTFLKHPNHVIRYSRGHDGPILDIAWSRSNFLLTASGDMTVCLWHVSQSEKLQTFQHKDIVTSVDFHPIHDRYFISGGFDGNVNLWDIITSSDAPSGTRGILYSMGGQCTIRLGGRTIPTQTCYIYILCLFCCVFTLRQCANPYSHVHSM